MLLLDPWQGGERSGRRAEVVISFRGVQGSDIVWRPGLPACVSIVDCVRGNWMEQQE
jgi:hypothetical protein